MRRVAITGMGIICSIGNSLEEVTRALQQGRSGVEFVPERKDMGFRSGLAGTLKDFSIPKLPKKYLRQMGQGSHLAVHAAQQAVADAGWRESDIKNERTGVVIGNSGNMLDIFEQCSTFYHRTRKLGGTALQRVLASWSLLIFRSCLAPEDIA